MKVSESSLLNVQSYVIEHERSLPTIVFLTQEADLNRLPLEAQYAERVLHVTSSLVQVREGPQCGKHRTRAVEHLDLQGVIGHSGGGFSGVNMQPEAQGCSNRRCGNVNGLGGGISVGSSVAIQPGIPNTGVRRFRRGVVKYRRSQGPRCGNAGFKPTVYDEVRCAAGRIHNQSNCYGVAQRA